MSEVANSPEKFRSSPERVYLESATELGMAFLYSKPGWLDMVAESMNGLSPKNAGRSLVATSEGLYVITRGYLVDIDRTLDTGTTVAHVIPSHFRINCIITIGEPFDLGEFEIPPVQAVLIDKYAPVHRNTQGTRLPHFFKDTDIAEIIAPIGKNEVRPVPSIVRNVSAGDYL